MFCTSGVAPTLRPDPSTGTVHRVKSWRHPACRAEGVAFDVEAPEVGSASGFPWPPSATRCSAPEARDQLQAVDSYEFLISRW